MHEISVKPDLPEDSAREVPRPERNSCALAPIGGVVPRRICPGDRHRELEDIRVLKELPRRMNGSTGFGWSSLPVIVRDAIHHPNQVEPPTVPERKPTLGVR